MKSVRRQRERWRSMLRADPVAPLLNCDDAAVRYFAQRDLADVRVADVSSLWSLAEAQKIVRRQQPSGAWKYPGGSARIRSAENYDQIETFRNLGYLVELYGFDKRSDAISRAADFLLGFQTNEGDIRGILGNQYMPYYTAAMTELLIKAGYGRDKRIAKIFRWLESMRQDDGGWAIPFRTRGRNLDAISEKTEPLEPDRSKPFSHLVTAMVLRAYAAEPERRRSPVAQKAAKLLCTRLFRSDPYPDRRTPAYWLRFSYPFWFTDLASATDSLTLLGLGRDEPQIERAAEWFISHQSPDGLWKLHTVRNKRFQSDLWVSLAICRILKRLYH